MPTRFGDQPARFVMRQRKIYHHVAAAYVGCPVHHVYNVVRGVIAPSPLIRERLPRLLGLAEEECFTPAALAAKSLSKRGVA